MIHLLFPRAVVIHVARDPLDQLASCMMNRLVNDPIYLLDFRALVLEYVQYLEVVQHFRSTLPRIRVGKATKANIATKGYNSKSNAKTNDVSVLIDVRYEELVADPERTMRHLLPRLGLQWDPQTLAVRHTESLSEVRCVCMCVYVCVCVCVCVCMYVCV